MSRCSIGSGGQVQPWCQGWDRGRKVIVREIAVEARNEAASATDHTVADTAEGAGVPAEDGDAGGWPCVFAVVL